jgi:hypothetical protein
MAANGPERREEAGDERRRGQGWWCSIRGAGTCGVAASSAACGTTCPVASCSVRIATGKHWRTGLLGLPPRIGLTMRSWKVVRAVGESRSRCCTNICTACGCWPAL